MNISLFTSSVKKQAYCEKKSVELLRSSYHQQDHLNVVVNREVISYCWCSADNKTKTLEEVENCDSPQKTLWGNYFTKKYHSCFYKSSFSVLLAQSFSPIKIIKQYLTYLGCKKFTYVRLDECGGGPSNLKQDAVFYFGKNVYIFLTTRD